MERNAEENRILNHCPSFEWEPGWYSTPPPLFGERKGGGGEVGLDGKRGAQTRYTRLTRGDEIKGVERESGWERRGKCKWN